MSFEEIDRLTGEQKLEAASEVAAKLLAQAREAGDPEGWTRALVRTVQLRMALAGYETAVRLLKDEAWPEGALYRATLNLFYAHSLVTYHQSYSWEIGQRERVVADDAVDLKGWTREQIYRAALAAYGEVWAGRDELAGLPVSRLAEYLEPNNYPEGIRGTLRDAVTYLLVELLADSSFWTPRQSNEVYLLDLEGLLAAGPEAASGSASTLADPAAHPLAKAVAVLADLEGWHAAAGRREAAFEARLERLRRLDQAFAAEADGERIRRDLTARLPAVRDLPWWSMGMATLAERVQATDRPDRLIEARRIAREGAEAYPGSPGARRCRALAAAIEAPDFHLAAMQSDGVGRRSLHISHKNMAALHFRAYPVDLVARAARGQDPFPPQHELRSFLKDRKAVKEWTVDLPSTPDFELHTTWAVPPLTAAGSYVVAASARPDFADSANRVAGVEITLGDLLLASGSQGWQASGDIDAVAVSGSSGKPAAGTAVRLYRRNWQRGHQLVATKTVDADGRAAFSLAPGQNYFLLASQGDSAAFLDGFWRQQRGPDEERSSALVYTDRAIYRPQQKLFWKVLAYRGRVALGKLAVARAAPVTVELLDPNGQAVATATVSTNDFGTASGEFMVPAGRPLGSWTVAARVNAPNGDRGAAGVRVEEYKRPTFEVTLTDPKEPLRLNRPARFTGEARYYFGLPVTHGDVRFTATREPVYPWWWGWFWPGHGGNAQAQIVASGSAELKEDGTFEIAVTPEADERLDREVTYRYRIQAEVTDEGGETRDASRSFRLGFVSVEAAIEVDGGFLPADEKVGVSLARRSLDGLPRAGEGTWTLHALAQPERAPLPSQVSPPEGEPSPYRTPGDAEQPRWERRYRPEAILRTFPDGRQLAGGSVTHGQDGKASIALPPLAAGAYRLRYRTVDDFGAAAETQRELIVAADQTPVALPLLLAARQTVVRVGETAELLVHSGLPGQTLYFEVYRDGKVSARRRLAAGSGSALLRIPVGESDRGGFGVRLFAVSEHEILEMSTAVNVPWDDREVKLSFETFRDKLRPGARETWRVKVQGAGAEAAAAELLASMYDRSLDLFAPHHPPSPLSLYPVRSSVPWLAASHGTAPSLWLVHDEWGVVPALEELHGDRLKILDAYGVGGPGGRYRNKLARGGAEMALESAAPPPPPPAVPAPVPQSAELLSLGYAADAAAIPEEIPEPVRGGQAAEQPPVPLRSNFAETAFWQPHLLTGPDGSAAIEFAVPDSVTSWTVWVHAVTRDFRSGSLSAQAVSVKELMVRPYLPRFLREGDRADLKVVVNNASDRTLSGHVALDILDPEGDLSLLGEFGLSPQAARLPFTVEPGGGANVTFPIAAPRRVGAVAFKVTATADDLGDGELRPLPLLPSRLHLAQSRFATLKDKDSRTLRFADLERGGDPTRIDEQLVVTVDAQLFYSVLAALPYLVDYPYECTEQTLNRFLSTGIAASLFDRYPAVGAMAAELAKRETLYETWDGADPNRKMALEETPWLVSSRGGDAGDLALARVLDPRVARAERQAALAKLEKAQLPSGAFPWWPGGPPSPYMTLYILYGFAKAAEFEVEVPREMVERGWSYLAAHYREDYARKIGKDECCLEFLTFLNYVASAYPDPSWMGDALSDDERRRILDWSFTHWKQHSPYLKGLLALTLQRAGRPKDAQLVWDSVMDSAKTTVDEGTFWQPEDRAWLWYNDTIETHAFALRVLTELAPADPRRPGLVQWLFLNKKLNHWKSTRATAEVLYSLAHFLEKEGQLGGREEARVSVGSQSATFTFEPDRYTGKKNQLVVPGDKLDPQRSAVTVEKDTKGLLFASATWHFSTEELPQEARGDLFTVERRYFKRSTRGEEVVLEPFAPGTVLGPGDEVEVQLAIASRAAAEYVHLRDPRPAGFEPDNARSGYRWDLGLFWYEETRDSGTNFFFEWLPAGQYTLKYRVRANLAGTFRAGPATLQSMYAPEFTAYSAGETVRVGAERER